MSVLAALATVTALLAVAAGDLAPLLMLSLIVIPLTGGVILARRPGNRIGLLMLAAGTVVMVSTACDAYARFTVMSGWPAGRWFAWVSNFTFWGPIELYLIVLLLIFPTGKAMSRRWSALIAVNIVLAGIQCVSDMFQRGRFDALGDYPEFTNPVVLSAVADRLDLIALIHDLGLLLSIGLAIASVVVRYRRAETVERQQLKWFLFVAVSIITLIVVMVVGGDLTWSGAAIVEAIAGVLMLIAVLIGLPVTIAMAVLRYRLYDIDRIVNRAVVYTSMTAILLATYLTTVLGLSSLVRVASGESSQFVVAVSTLIVAALFRPLRNLIQGVVDRRFNRSRYDAAQTLEWFTARLRDEIDLTTLTAEVCGVVQETMQPAHVALWLRPSIASPRSWKGSQQ